MDSERFDSIAKALAGGGSISRHVFLKLLTGVTASGVAALAGHDLAAGKKKNKKNKRKKRSRGQGGANGEQTCPSNTSPKGCPNPGDTPQYSCKLAASGTGCDVNSGTPPQGSVQVGCDGADPYCFCQSNQCEVNGETYESGERVEACDPVACKGRVGCDNDNDCDSNEVCCDNICVAGDCCGNPDCAAGETCDANVCVCAGNNNEPCANNRTCCPDGCVNLNNDEENCGACDNPCDLGEVCNRGECVAECAQQGGSCENTSDCCEPWVCRDAACQTPLLLTYIVDCNPSVNTWRVRNFTNQAIDYTWDDANSSLEGGGTAPANSDSFFQTPSGSQTIRLFVDGTLVQTKASGPDQLCEAGQVCCPGDNEPAVCQQCCDNQDCDAGERCENGTCVPTTCAGSCAKDTDCPDIADCFCNTQTAQCETPAEVCPGTCENNNDCANLGADECVCFFTNGLDVSAEGFTPIGGVCGECLSSGGTCYASTECCGQLVCRDGICAVKSKQKGRRCNKHGQSCRGDNDCCAQGVCYSGKCGEKDTHCNNNGECAQGFKCVGGKRTGDHRRCRRRGRQLRNKRNRGRG